MKAKPSLTPKKPAKDQRARSVLFGLIDLYIQTGKPIGSNTLRENGFDSLSSATIRNYFVQLEEEGLLKQQHSSGGRIPTSLGFRIYAAHCSERPEVEPTHHELLKKALAKESREVASLIEKAAETLSELSQCAVFLSSPRFDQDFILSAKILPLDNTRCLCVLMTDFGLIHTEVLYTAQTISEEMAVKMEAYFNSKITGVDSPTLSTEEEGVARRFYKEVMLRHIVSHTNFSSEDLYKTGFSKLLTYTDFNNAAALANGLSLFENEEQLRSLLQKCGHNQKLSYWVGEDLYPFAPQATACSILAVPYRINQTTSGAMGILGPYRMPYRTLFGLLETTALLVSETLTRSIYKFKITFRQCKHPALDSTQHLLLE